MFHRYYDISCILEQSERDAVQHAIDGTNQACSDSVDAWLYVQGGRLLNDNNRILGDHDSIPKTIFRRMAVDCHSG